MASIVRNRKQLFKRVYSLNPRCEEYEPGCYNCFRYKFLDHYRRFPNEKEWNDWFYHRNLANYFD